MALGPPAEQLSDRTIRAVASGTRRGTIEWAAGQDISAQGLFAARRSLLEALSAGARSTAAVPRVEGVLVGGDAIVVEHPGGGLENWWADSAQYRDRVARFLELMGAISRAVGRIVEPAAGEGLVPVVRPRALRCHADGRWMVTEFATLVDLPPELGSADVLSGFLAPETVQGRPSSDGRPRVVWGIASTIVAICAWANASVDGATGEPIESPAGHSHLGRLLSDLHTRGMFGGGGGALQQAFEKYPHPDRLPTNDREMVLRFADQSGVGRAVGGKIIEVLDAALAIDPTIRPTPEALAERLERVARDARSAVFPRAEPEVSDEAVSPPSPEPPPEVAEPPKKERARSRRREPSVGRVVRELQENVAQLQTDLKQARTQVEELRAANDALVARVRALPAPPSHLVLHIAFALSILFAAGLGVAGWYWPVPVEPAPVYVPVQVYDAESASGATPLNPLADPDQLGTVVMRGGTITLRGERGVYGAGLVPPGSYRVIARPYRGPEQDLGQHTVHAGEDIAFGCATGVCSLVPL